MGVDAADRDVDLDDGRKESVNERMDRNWNEMLQEVRVTQTGTQILAGFLLTLAFQPKFAQLPVFDQRLFLFLCVTATVTTALALAPVHLHRSLFRQRAKVVVVHFGHLLLRTALCGLAVVMTGSVLLVFDVATGNRSAALTAAGGVLVAIVLLAALPNLARSDWARQRIQRTVI